MRRIKLNPCAGFNYDGCRERWRKMRVGFYGGSFDPPHCGHLAVAKAAAEAFALDTVLLAPTARQPLKPQGAEASFDDRLAMVRLLCEGESGLEASELEAPSAESGAAVQPNYTIDSPVMTSLSWLASMRFSSWSAGAIRGVCWLRRTGSWLHVRSSQSRSWMQWS